MDLITRKEAKSRGLKRYFTGKPCKRGHVSPRKVCDKRCIQCHNEITRIYRTTPDRAEYERNRRQEYYWHRGGNIAKMRKIATKSKHVVEQQLVDVRQQITQLLTEIEELNGR